VIQKFYSNGKLLITGEYVVLDGATAFALPTKFGQFLEVENTNTQTIIWKSYDADGSVWFSDTISFDTIMAKQNSGEQNAIRKKLIDILHEAYKLNPSFIDHSKGYAIKTKLTFPRFWGLGTSSTLINNLADWLKINPYHLLQNSFGGSGYDIACAQNNQGILYRLDNENPIVTTLKFEPEFRKNLYFVYLNKKQNSRNAINNYINKQSRIEEVVTKITQITNRVIETTNIAEFAQLLEAHENILSNVLETSTVKEAVFPDFKGTLKSLGAWGGDFILAVSATDPTAYFNTKGYTTVVPYNEMIK